MCCPRMWKIDWNDLQLQLVCCASTIYMSCIFSEWNLGTQGIENHWKIVRCVITNTRKSVLALVNFQNNYYNINYQIIYQLVYLLQNESMDRLRTRVRVRTLVNYQSTTDIGLGDRHVTWKVMWYSLERSGRTQGLEGSGRVQRWSQGQEMTSRDKGSSWCTHGVHMYSGD